MALTGIIRCSRNLVMVVRYIIVTTFEIISIEVVDMECI